MGWFDSDEDIKKKEIVKKMQSKIASEGLGNIINKDDYQKVIIEQNETIIALLGVIAIGQSGLGGDAFTLIHTSRYYEALSKIIEK